MGTLIPSTEFTELSAPSALAQVPGVPRLHLEASRGWQAINVRELWRYRELVGFLALRDLQVRYKQTALGTAWAVIQPVVNVCVFTLFFNRLAGIQAEPGVPYAVSTFCALLPWQLFETSLSQAGNSLVNSQQLITKVYFPRLGIPIASLVSGLADFGIALVVLVLMMAGYYLSGWHFRPGWPILLLPVFLLLDVMAALAVGLWLSALNVEYRDVRYVIPFLARVWFLATPVVYLSDIVPGRWRVLYGLNPMAGVIDGFRWALLGSGRPPGPMFLVSTLVAASLLVGGLYYFRRVEKSFADLV